MVGAGLLLRHDECRATGNSHPAPRAAWKEEELEAGGGMSAWSYASS